MTSHNVIHMISFATSPCLKASCACSSSTFARAQGLKSRLSELAVNGVLSNLLRLKKQKTKTTLNKTCSSFSLNVLLQCENCQIFASKKSSKGIANREYYAYDISLLVIIHMPCIYIYIYNIYTRYHIYICHIYIFIYSLIKRFCFLHGHQCSPLISTDPQPSVLGLHLPDYIWAVLRSVPYFLGGVPKGGGRLTRQWIFEKVFLVCLIFSCL